MVTFNDLWKAAPGTDYVCDATVFENQCAMRLGQALRDCGVVLSDYRGRYCNQGFSIKHRPGHHRSAQELANVFYRKPKLLGPQVKRRIFKGSIRANWTSISGKLGMVFIMNGWDSTDHIDLFDGIQGKFRGTAFHQDFMARGQQTWFWELPGSSVVTSSAG